METAIIMTPNDLDRIMSEMKQELFQYVNKAAKEEAPMGVKDACKFMRGICSSTLTRKMKKGLPFHTDVDGEYYFYASEINNWIKNKKK